MQTTVESTVPSSAQSASRQIRVLALRAVDGAGGGADKIILRNAAHVSPQSVHMAVCFVHHVDDTEFDLTPRASRLGLNCYDVTRRGPFDPQVLPKLRSVVREFAPDIIHSHDYKASYLATRLAQSSDVLRLATSHGWTGDKWRERNLLYPADKMMLRSFPGVIAVSAEIRDTLIRWGANPARVQVVLNGVDAQQYQPSAAVRQRVRHELGFQPEHVVLGAVGRAEQQKRFDLLIGAFAQLAQRNPNYRLVIAGEGSLLARLQADIERRKLDGVCHLLGHRDQMVETYQAFDMLVQSSDYEGTPTVVVEAMALRIPVVATDVGGTGQLLEDRQHGLLVPRRDTDALCNAVERTLAECEQTAARVRRARQRVETTLSFDTRIKTLETIYTQLYQHGHLGPS